VVQNGYPTQAQVDAEGTLRVSTADLDVKFSLLGGRIISAGLPKFRQNVEEKSALDIITHVEQSPFPLEIASGEVNDRWTKYRIISPAQVRGKSKASLEISSNTTVVLRGELPDGREITKKYSFQPKGYLLDVDVSLNAPGNASQPVVASWTKFVSEEEGSKLDPYKAAGFAWFDGQKAHRKTFNDIETNAESVGKVRWLSIGDKYFVAILLLKDELVPARYTKNDLVFSAELLGSATNNAFSLFLGPKSYRLLDETGFELQRNIDFGMFGIVSAPLLGLLHFLFDIFGNYGLAIVGLTIIVRLAMFPLNSASFKQMKAMQDIKPELDKLREEVEDKQQQQAALMALYKKKGVNPLGGCLPMMLQMPIFIGLYAALLLSVELRHAHFTGWIVDLSAPEKLMISGVGVPFMVILFVLSMIVQQATTPSTMDATQKKVMLIMPIVMGFMFANFPAGLTLYWLTSNLISIGQHKAMHHKDSDTKGALKITLLVSVAVFALAVFVVAIG
jgi:YidC/Oxa1 family membrane protein insertase